MSSTALADQGLKAIAHGQYEDGISKLSEVIKERPAPLWLLERSKAHLRTNKLDEALEDAEKALRIAYDRANRDLMIEAQLRRCITLLRLQRYADADICAFWALRLLDKAKAAENDGQLSKVDSDGNYTVRVSDVRAEAPANRQADIQDAMQDNGRAKVTSLRNQAISWRIQALTQLQNSPAGHPGRKVTSMEKYPNTSGAAPPIRPKDEDVVVDSPTDHESDRHRESDDPYDAWRLDHDRFLGQRRQRFFRSGFYQTENTINADIFIRNIPVDGLSVTADKHKVVIGPTAAADATGVYPKYIHLYLWGKIKPDEIKYNVKSMKIELVLQKETPGKWPALLSANAEFFGNVISGSVDSHRPSLEQFGEYFMKQGHKDPYKFGLPAFGDDQLGWYDALLQKIHAGLEDSKVAAVTAEKTSDPPRAAAEAPSSTPSPAPVNSQVNAAKAASSSSISSAPAYPTSSKKGAVNWDKITDLDDDEEDAKDGDVGSFFQKIYKDADDDTRRAMMKSYIESNGTSLSTSWAEAKQKKYDTQPPDGAEAKKWDE
ncbi:SGS-domain-containing protein [Hypoxylon fragiforme]|uniref:SGS-domain-containing protein n=1 Tax=Hypoxylon fragiforme TaxID=63214 RepID=UPI0020C624C7|nr:SGS-domain-containing protein [Hypoxylon fragiforme]KAI2608124.1 SGS-domain-containing protein [Hypoxylon fragiforme]